MPPGTPLTLQKSVSVFADHHITLLDNTTLSRRFHSGLIPVGMGSMYRRRIFLPIDICTEEGVSEEDILQAKTNPGIANVALKVATRAKVCPLL